MAWNHRETDGVVILDLPVYLRSDEDLNRLRQTIGALIDSGKCNLILNFQRVTLINSAGIAHLLRAVQKARDGGGDIKAIHLQPAIRDLFQYAGLLTKIDLISDEIEAVKRFQEITCP